MDAVGNAPVALWRYLVAVNADLERDNDAFGRSGDAGLAAAVDYALVPRRFASVVISDFFMMVFIFTTLNACLESFFFRRADPVWLFFLMAVIGLRLCARFPIRPRAS